MSTEDRRLGMVGDQLSLGKVQKLEDVFAIVPKTVLARIVGMNNGRIASLAINPEKLMAKDIRKMAQALNMQARDLFALVDNQLLDREGHQMIPLKSKVKKVRSQSQAG